MKPETDQPKKPVALETREEATDGRRFSPSIGRNKDVVRDTFLLHMPHTGRVLEIASGTGEHGAHIVAACPNLIWTYSDIDEESRASQAAWAARDKAAQLCGPLHLDVTGDWNAAQGPWDAMFCANMVHIAPFAAAKGLIAGAGATLKPGGRLFLYGPFAREGAIAPSNAQFDADLKRRDPAWGVRDLDLDILPLAGAAGLALKQVITMPANNLSVIFEKN